MKEQQKLSFHERKSNKRNFMSPCNVIRYGLLVSLENDSVPYCRYGCNIQDHSIVPFDTGSFPSTKRKIKDQINNCSV